MNWSVDIAGVQMALRASVAAAVAVALAQLFQFQSLIYVFIAAVIVTDLKPSESRRLALRRIVATVVGGVCGALLGPMLPSSSWSIGLGVLVAMLACQLVQVPDGAKVAGFICGIILLDDSTRPWTDAVQRFNETALGVVVAWAVSCVPKLMRVEEPKK